MIMNLLYLLIYLRSLYLIIDIFLSDDFNSLYENNKFLYDRSLSLDTQTNVIAMKKIC